MDKEDQGRVLLKVDNFVVGVNIGFVTDFMGVEAPFYVIESIWASADHHIYFLSQLRYFESDVLDLPLFPVIWPMFTQTGSTIWLWRSETRVLMWVC